jgi:hypothetical protein
LAGEAILVEGLNSGWVFLGNYFTNSGVFANFSPIIRNSNFAHGEKISKKKNKT